MDTNEFIHSLVMEGARKPMTRLWLQFAVWMAGMVAWLLTVIAYEGLRPDFRDSLHKPFYGLELLLLVCLGGSSALAALTLARPDACQIPRLRFAPLFMLVMWAIAAFLDMDAATPSALTQAINERHFDCVACIMTFCIPPGIIMALIIRHGAPVRSVWAGGLTAGSVTSFAYLAMRFIEPTDNPFHLLIWHALPVLALCVVSMIAGSRYLRWRVRDVS